MIGRILKYLRGQVLGLVAIFIALGGTGYAAVEIPKHSIGSDQLKNGAVGAPQLRRGAVGPSKLGGAVSAYIRAYAIVSASGQASGKPSATVSGWANDSGNVTFRGRIYTGCLAIASTPGGTGSEAVDNVNAHFSGATKSTFTVTVGAQPPSNTGSVLVEVLCPT